MISFRTDTNEQIATGHLMRCVSIAEAARALGEPVCFILSDETACAFLAEKSFPYVVLQTAWDRMEEELPVLLPLLKERNVGRLLIDSYSVTPAYLSAVNAAVEAWYMDDLDAFPYPVHGLICYANYYRKFDYESRYRNAELLLGTKYAPLRPEFANLPEHPYRGTVKKVLILSGGADPEDVLLQFLTKLDWSDCNAVDVVCGRYYEKYEMLSACCVDKKNITVHRSVPSLIDYMKNADLAISAGGVTLYELCACGTLTITYAMADNQLDNVHSFAADGLMPYAGDVRTDDVIANLRALLTEYQHQTETEQQALSKRLQATVDGLGATRIARRLANLTQPSD